jgi:hypothetical protein
MEGEQQVSHHLVRIGDKRGDVNFLLLISFFQFLR